MIPSAVLVYYEELSEEDKNLIKLIHFFGLECPVSSMNDWLAQITASKTEPNEICLLASANTLLNLSQSAANTANTAFKAFERLHSLFVYGLFPSGSMSRLLQQLTQNQVQSISKLRDSDLSYDISPDFREISGPFTGVQVRQANRDIDFVFEVNPTHTLHECIIEIDKHPFFLKIPRGNNNLFLLACKTVLDIDRKVDANLDIRNYFSQIVPIIMFLKHTFRERCWSANKQYASFIVDDPLLRANYGFMDNGKLTETMKRNRFATTIAFIPWNYKRSRSADSRFFRENKEKYSLCVHGCDHTWGEFASTDNLDLNNRINLAIKRMQIHAEKTGIEFDRVMVFPQGLFSTRAMNILKLNHFLGAVNTAVLPRDSEEDGIEITQLLAPAVMKYHSFPLFTRRYPSEGIENFAFDILLGKPCFIVVHHDYFKSGYENLGQFIDNINSLEELQWGGLGETISNCFLHRSSSNGDVLIKMYGNKLILKNPYKDSRRFTVIKDEESSSFSGIRINGELVDYTLDDHTLEFPVELFPNEMLVIEATYKNDFPKTLQNYSISYNIKTAATRYLSEIRDNFLSKNEAVLALAQQLKNLLN